jgi:hypothetical protein
MVSDANGSRFAYGVRPSSSEFFNELVNFSPEYSIDEVPSVRRVLEDQPWFFLHWRLDPTIQAVLTMLDAIHERFQKTAGLYARLVDEEVPAITFHLLPLEHFGLSDDLYIKMNARGKPLTEFELFKARFGELLKNFANRSRKLDDSEVRAAAFFENRIDGQWTEFFWNHQHSTFDEAVIYLIWALIRVSLDPASSSFVVDSSKLGERWLKAGFALFHDSNWLTPQFADYFMDLLEAWSADSAKFTPQLPTTTYFDEDKFFRKAMASPWALTYFELDQFAAFVYFITHHHGTIQKSSFLEWMRVITNLASNSDIERPEEFGRSLAGLKKLVPHGNRILEWLADAKFEALGFSPQQMREEVLKAKLILSHLGWRARIESAEEHGYFRGQIEFLLDFSAVCLEAEKAPPNEWPAELHVELQNRFDNYLKKAKLTFNQAGIIASPMTARLFLWERALLTEGDYLLRNSNNCSFLTNPSGNWDSWKRYLRGNPVGGSLHRTFLKNLWDRLDPDTDLPQQLAQIIREAPDLEPWRAAIVKHPRIIEYCEEREIRKKQGVPEIYLLKKFQMNGAHSELFSYALYLELSTETARSNLAPLILENYQSVDVKNQEPHVSLTFTHAGHVVSFFIESAGGRFRVYVHQAELEHRPDVEGVLYDKMEFDANNQAVERFASREEIYQVLRDLAQNLSSLMETS